MIRRYTLTNLLTIGTQPTEGELLQLAEEGFKTIVNLCLVGEEEQPLSPREEEDCVRRLGMEYLHIPVKKAELHLDQVDRFSQAMLQLPDPTYVHSGTGKRAGLFALMHTAIEEGWPSHRVIEQAEEMGFEEHDPELEKFMAGYARTRRT